MHHGQVLSPTYLKRAKVCLIPLKFALRKRMITRKLERARHWEQCNHARGKKAQITEVAMVNVFRVIKQMCRASYNNFFLMGPGVLFYNILYDQLGCFSNDLLVIAWHNNAIIDEITPTLALVNPAICIILILICR
jgi:hypothetical protein